MGKNVLHMKYPSTWWKSAWREGIPLGNGRTGALVYGAIHKETIMLTHEDAWWQGESPRLPDLRDQLAVVRKLMDDGKYVEARDLYTEKLKENDYSPIVAKPLPIGDCRIQMSARNAFKNYSRSLDMQKGEATIQWEDDDTLFKRKTFVSREKDTIFCKITSSGSLKIDGKVFLELHNIDDARTPHGMGKLPEEDECLVKGEYIYYSMKSDDNTYSGAVAKVISIGESLFEEDGKLVVRDSEQVDIRIKVFTKSDRETMYKTCRDALDKLDDTYESYRKKHEAIHSELFNDVQFDIGGMDSGRSNEELLLHAYSGDTPADMIEKMWAYGRYLLISSTYKGGMPCALHGLWCGEYSGFWPFNMANENLQMIYWQALSGNMPELLLSVFNYYESNMDDFRENAERLYGCRGIYIPAPTVPGSGKLKSIQHHIIYWTGAAGWIAQHYYDYYCYTNDKTFLRERALPFMKEVAMFYEDFLVEDDQGYLKSYPAVSPENTPGNFYDGNGMGEAMELTQNPTMDFAIIKELLTNLINGSKQEDMYSESMGIWESMLEKIPPYEINDDGAVKEWLHDAYEDNYHHRHQSHLYPLFPGIEVTAENNPELFDAFVTAARKRLVIGLKEQSGWSLVHMACNYARMEEGDLALECLEILARSCVLNNFFVTHNDWRNMGITVDLPWAPFQIDANMGWTAAIQEMSLFSTDDIIRILPAIPGKWRKGNISGLLGRGGANISIRWDFDLQEVDVDILPSRDMCIDLKLPGDIESVKCCDKEALLIQGRFVKSLRLKKNEKKALKVLLTGRPPA